MRPSNPAHSPVQSLKSPIGAFFTYALLLGFFLTGAAAQTRLDSSQVVPLNGDVNGSFASTKLRDFNSALDHGNGTTNSVASAISGCGVTITCSILVPPEYGTVEPLPGYGLNFANITPPATTPGNIQIFDHRYSDARMLVNFLGFPSGQTSTPTGWLYNYYSQEAQNQQLYSFFLRQFSIDGGNSQSVAALSYADKTTWATVLSNEVSHTPGQHEDLLMGGQLTSIGDFSSIKSVVNCYGGFTTEGDLGCHAEDSTVASGTVEYSGTLSGSPATGASSLTLAPTQGAGTQGSGRFLVKTNAGTISTGSISNVQGGYAPTAITGTGTSWPVSSVIGNLGTNVPTPGSLMVTPNSFSVGSMSGIQTTSLVCVSDGESFEMVYPTAVTATTFTANFAKIHPYNATIAVGGLCGYVMDLTADDVTNSTFPVKTQTITGTLHFAWPMVASTSSTSALMWVAGGGGFQSIVTRWNANNANGYVLYPFAEVTSTQQGGGLSNTLALGPNQVNWTAGDTVSEFLYPANAHGGGQYLVESYYPSVGGVTAFGLTYNLPLQGNEAMISLKDDLPNSFYYSHGGQYAPPVAIHIIGPTSQSITVDQPGDIAALAVGCVSPCNTAHAIVAAGNSSYYDFLVYDQNYQKWILTANSSNKQYYLGGYSLYTPFQNFYLAQDGNSVGFISVQEVRSNTASNTDLNGELAFSNASTAVYSLQGAYVSHPECVARPQFDPGSTNRSWVTYSGSSVTIHFANAVSGTVTYSCVARN